MFENYSIIGHKEKNVKNSTALEQKISRALTLCYMLNIKVM